MQRDSIDTSAHAPEAAKARRTRVLALIAAIFFFGTPIAYLAVTASQAGPVLAGSQQASPAPVAADLSTLESLAASSPTPAHRLDLAVAYIHADRPGSAVPTLLALVAEDKGNAVAWNDLCVAHTMLKDYGAAIPNCEQALRIQPGYELAENNLKWARDQQRRAAGPPNAQEKTPLAARDAAFYIDEGLGFLHRGENDRAIESWRRALDLDPHSAIAANNIGTAYMLEQQPARAMPWFDKAIAMDPSLQLAKNNLAWAQTELAKLAK
jgi:tetratricopeptide (TPR) repeat protein